MVTEVAHYVDVTQFEQNENAFLCAVFAPWQNAAAGQQAPLHNAEWIDENADRSYQEVTRLAATDLTARGLSLLEMWYVLHLASLHYQEISADKAVIRAWLEHRYPVLVTVHEDSVYDVEIGDKVPYAWLAGGKKTTWNHTITLTGLAGATDFLARDPANIGPSGVRPGPRTYDGDMLSIVNATLVVLPWLQRPTSGDPGQFQAPHVNEYTIRPGDSLFAIAAEHNTSMANLLAQNQAVLDAAARKEGYASCFEGRLIFPGTVLKWH